MILRIKANHKAFLNRRVTVSTCGVNLYAIKEKEDGRQETVGKTDEIEPEEKLQPGVSIRGAAQMSGLLAQNVIHS